MLPCSHAVYERYGLKACKMDQIVDERLIWRDPDIKRKFFKAKNRLKDIYLEADSERKIKSVVPSHLKEECKRCEKIVDEVNHFSFAASDGNQQQAADSFAIHGWHIPNRQRCVYLVLDDVCLCSRPHAR